MPPKRLFACLVTSLLITHSAPAENKVLFIGNSYTFGSGGTQSVPDIFDALANAGGQEDPTTVTRAVSGKDYKYHYQNSTSHIQQEQWTHVILQNLSTGPTHVGSISDHTTYGTLLYASIITNNPNTQVMLYQTWARQATHSIITGTSTSSTFATTDEMLDELVTNYDALAASLTSANPDKSPTLVNPVGIAFQRAGGNLEASDPDYIDLFSDGTHANDLGYYLSACVHYSSIYLTSPEGLFSHSAITALGLNVSASDAALLESTAWDVVVSRGLVDESYLIDFGTDDQATPSIASPGESWNNVNASVGLTAGSSVDNLTSARGKLSEIDLSILTAFDASSRDGSSPSVLYPSTASSDSLIGQHGTHPSFQLSELVPTTAYVLTFYASETEPTEQLQTRYTVSGLETTSLDVNPQNNTENSISTDLFYPNASGEITISLSPGPENNSSAQLVFLNALEVTAYLNSELQVLTQPQSQSIEQNNSVTFSATVNSPRPPSYQWYVNGAPIPDANQASYTQTAGDELDGSTYYAVINNGLRQIQTATATLTVVPDSTAPELASVTPQGNHQLQLLFNEAMSEAAINPQNYTVFNQGHAVPVLAAEASEDGSAVTLEFATELLGNFMLTVNPTVSDRSANPLTDDTSFIGQMPHPADATIYLDFGSNFTVGSQEPDTWNLIPNLTSSIRAQVDGGTPYVFKSNLKTASDLSTNIALSMTDNLYSTNTAGTADGPYPPGASQDSFFGHTGSFNGYTDNGQGIFEFNNCDPNLRYTFIIYASRIGGSQSRETRYTLTGTNTQTGDLEIYSNVSNTLILDSLQPTEEGKLTLTLTDGPNNKSSNKYFYIGLLEIQISEPLDAPKLYTPASTPIGFFIDWTGDATLHCTENLNTPWLPVEGVVASPHLDTDKQAQRFYRLNYDSL